MVAFLATFFLAAFFLATFFCFSGSVSAQARERWTQPWILSGSSTQSPGSVTYSFIGRPARGSSSAAPSCPSSSARSGSASRTNSCDPSTP